MSQIKGKNTKPELITRKFLHSKGFRFRLHDKSLPGKPDIILKKYKTVVFIHGCFWHGHIGCKYFVIPKTRRDWWQKKIQATQKRDNTTQNDLIALGWKVLVVWECELKKDKIEQTLNKLQNNIIE